MKIFKVITIILLGLTIVGLVLVKSHNSIKKDEENISEDKTNNIILDENNDSLSNTLSDKNNIPISLNSSCITNLDARNEDILKEYTRAVSIVKEFCLNNSLSLNYIQSIKDNIGRLDESYNSERIVLLKDLENNGAETVNYFTDDESLNVDLSIGFTDGSNNVNGEYVILGETYSKITYKASIKNVDSSFNFKNSKLNEFRNMILQDSSLNYDKLNEYVKNMFLGKYDNNIVFLNKIDENRYEIIRIENNNCYYKLVYNPLL